jgi:hypothetical protein
LKPGDSKYSYIDPAIILSLNGDNSCYNKAQAVFQYWSREMSASYSTSTSFWTEREAAFALAAAVGWYELSSDPAALTRARALVAMWDSMSSSSGAPLHTLQQHGEEFDAPYATMRMTSPWMAALWFEYLQRYHRITQDAAALRIASRYGDFLIANCLYDGSANHSSLAGYTMPYYLCGANRSYYDRETPSEGDGEHTPDVMGILALSVHAKRQLGQDPAAALAAYTQLRRSAEFFVSRLNSVNPPRKISWWIGSSYDSTALVQ